jgi:hypothetical protein
MLPRLRDERCRYSLTGWRGDEFDRVSREEAVVWIWYG